MAKRKSNGSSSRRAQSSNGSGSGSPVTGAITLADRVMQLAETQTVTVESIRPGREKEVPQRIFSDPVQDLAFYNFPQPWDKIISSTDIDRMARYAAMMPHYPRHIWNQMFASVKERVESDSHQAYDARTMFERDESLCLASSGDQTDTDAQVKAFVAAFQHYVMEIAELNALAHTYFTISAQRGYSFSSEAASKLKFSVINSALAEMETNLPVNKFTAFLAIAANPVCIANDNQGGYTIVIPDFLETGQSYGDEPLIGFNFRDPSGAPSAMGMYAPTIPVNMMEIDESESPSLMPRAFTHGCYGHPSETASYRSRCLDDYYSQHTIKSLGSASQSAELANLSTRLLNKIERFTYKWGGRYSSKTNVFGGNNRLIAKWKEWGWIDGTWDIKATRDAAVKAASSAVKWDDFLSSMRATPEFAPFGMAYNTVTIDDAGATYTSGNDTSFLPDWDALEDNNYDEDMHDYIIARLNDNSFRDSGGALIENAHPKELPYTFFGLTNQDSPTEIASWNEGLFAMADISIGGLGVDTNDETTPSIDFIEQSPLDSLAGRIMTVGAKAMASETKLYRANPSDTPWLKAQVETFMSRVEVPRLLDAEQIFMAIPKSIVLWNPLDMLQQSAAVVLDTVYADNETSWEYLVTSLQDQKGTSPAVTSTTEGNWNQYASGTYLDVAVNNWYPSTLAAFKRHVKLFIGQMPDLSPAQLLAWNKALVLNPTGVTNTLRQKFADFVPMPYMAKAGYGEGYESDGAIDPSNVNVNYEDKTSHVGITVDYTTAWAEDRKTLEGDDAYERLYPRIYGSRAFQFFYKPVNVLRALVTKTQAIITDRYMDVSAATSGLSQVEVGKSSSTSTPGDNRDWKEGGKVDDTATLPLTKGKNAEPYDTGSQMRKPGGRDKRSYSSRKPRRSSSKSFSKPKSDFDFGKSSDDKDSSKSDSFKSDFATGDKDVGADLTLGAEVKDDKKKKKEGDDFAK